MSIWLGIKKYYTFIGFKNNYWQKKTGMKNIVKIDIQKQNIRLKTARLFFQTIHYFLFNVYNWLNQVNIS